MKQLKKSKVLLVAAALLITSTTALAQQGTTRTAATQNQAASASKGTKASAHREASGKVTDVKDVKVRGGSETNKVVLLETADGKRIAVDLGASSQLTSAEIKQGSPLTVRGEIVNIKTKPYLMANTVTAGDKKMQVKRNVKDGKQGKAEQSKQFKGEITKLNEVKVKGYEQPHRVAILKTDKNKQLYVDLGPADQLQKANLDAGAKVTVKGRPMKIKGHAILAVSQLEANGQKINIKREPKQQTQQM